MELRLARAKYLLGQQRPFVTSPWRTNFWTKAEDPNMFIKVVHLDDIHLHSWTLNWTCARAGWMMMIWAGWLEATRPQWGCSVHPECTWTAGSRHITNEPSFTTMLIRWKPCGAQWVGSNCRLAAFFIPSKMIKNENYVKSNQAIYTIKRTADLADFGWWNGSQATSQLFKIPNSVEVEFGGFPNWELPVPVL